jgi:hypothetical protein
MLMVTESDRTRAGYIAGLRMLADLLERVPEVPYDEYGITFALDGTEAEAFEVLDRAAEALAAAGVEIERRETEHARSVEFVIGAVRYGFSRMYDTQWAAFQARQSYERNVQVA